MTMREVLQEKKNNNVEVPGVANDVWRSSFPLSGENWARRRERERKSRLIAIIIKKVDGDEAKRNPNSSLYKCYPSSQMSKNCLLEKRTQSRNVGELRTQSQARLENTRRNVFTPAISNV